MVRECENRFGRYFLFLLNLIGLIVGFGVLCFGVLIVAGKASFLNPARFNKVNEGFKINDETTSRSLTAQKDIEQIGYVFIATGAFIFVISFLGCCGAARESRCLLTAYGLLVFLLVILQTGGIAYTATHKSQIAIGGRDALVTSIEKYYTFNTEPNVLTWLWDFLMRELHCCGANNYQDFRNVDRFKLIRAQKVPEACCKLKEKYATFKQEEMFAPIDPGCKYDPTPRNSYMNEGCYDVLQNWTTENTTLMYGMIAAIIGAQAVAVLLVVSICKAIRREKAPLYHPYH